MYNNNTTNKKGARSLEEVLAMFWKKVTSLEETIKVLENKLDNNVKTNVDASADNSNKEIIY